MSGTNIKDNKVMVKEDVIIFPNGTKILTNVADADVDIAIRDMTINPGDMVITQEGNLNVMKQDNSFLDLSADSGGGDSGVTRTKYSLSYDDFTSEAGTLVSIPLFTLPAKAILTEVVIHTTAQFSNLAMDSITALVGILGQENKYGDLVVSDPASGTSFVKMPNAYLENMENETEVLVSIDATTSEVSTITEGTLDVYIEYKLLAD